MKSNGNCQYFLNNYEQEKTKPSKQDT
jgi:hypothetical protein